MTEKLKQYKNQKYLNIETFRKSGLGVYGKAGNGIGVYKGGAYAFTTD